MELTKMRTAAVNHVTLAYEEREAASSIPAGRTNQADLRTN